MSRGRQNVANTLKEQAGRITGRAGAKYKPHGSCYLREQQPQRYGPRGMKLAVRALSQELLKVRARHLHQVSFF